MVRGVAPSRACLSTNPRGLTGSCRVPNASSPRASKAWRPLLHTHKEAVSDERLLRVGHPKWAPGDRCHGMGEPPLMSLSHHAFSACRLGGW